MLLILRVNFISLACLALLAGCAGRMIEAGMTGMVGQPLSAAVAKLGLPTEERVIAGQKVYVWYTGRLIEGTTSACRIRAIMAGDVITSGIIPFA